MDLNWDRAKALKNKTDTKTRLGIEVMFFFNVALLKCFINLALSGSVSPLWMLSCVFSTNTSGI